MLSSDRIRATKMMIDGLAVMASKIPLSDAVEVVAEISRTETLLPIVDPTGFQRISKTMPAHGKVAQAFLEFRRALEELKEN